MAQSLPHLLLLLLPLPLPLHSKWRKSLRDLKGFIKFVNSTKSRAPTPAHVLTPDWVDWQGGLEGDWFQGHYEFKHYMAAIRSNCLTAVIPQRATCCNVAATHFRSPKQNTPTRCRPFWPQIPPLLLLLRLLLGHLTADDLCACLQAGQPVCTSACIFDEPDEEQVAILELP